MKNVSQYSFLHTHHYFPTGLGLIRRSLCFFFCRNSMVLFSETREGRTCAHPSPCFKRTRIRSGSFLLIAAFGQFDGIGIVQSDSETLTTPAAAETCPSAPAPSFGFVGSWPVAGICQMMFPVSGSKAAHEPAFTVTV